MTKQAKELDLQFDYARDEQCDSCVQINVGLDGYKHYGYFKVSIEDAERYLKRLQESVSAAKAFSIRYENGTLKPSAKAAASIGMSYAEYHSEVFAGRTSEMISAACPVVVEPKHQESETPPWVNPKRVADNEVDQVELFKAKLRADPLLAPYL